MKVSTAKLHIELVEAKLLLDLFDKGQEFAYIILILWLSGAYVEYGIQGSVHVVHEVLCDGLEVVVPLETDEPRHLRRVPSREGDVQTRVVLPEYFKYLLIEANNAYLY